MNFPKGLIYLAALALLALVCHAAIGANPDHDGATTHALTVDANGDDIASISDFDGDGTIGFGDFVIFARVFGAHQGDEKYDATYDLNGDGEIGFSDFVIFVQNFGRDAPSPVVTIPDANLRVATEAALDKATGAPITEAEMATLDSLAASDAEITDLTGLEFAVNLTYLSLNDNDITDISALSELTILERLWLSNNRIVDISSLSKLTNLTRLSLGSNNITDVSALSGLINLRMLILRSNRISDLAPLAANKGLDRGVTVDITDNPLNAASENTHIPALQARGVSVSFAPSPAVAIPDAKLRGVIEEALGKASGVPITQAEMATLDSLDASDAEITDLTGLESAVNLTRLDLGWEKPKPGHVPTNSNEISDLAPLSGLTQLISLDLAHNNISNISVLSSLTHLTSLDLEFNNITDVSALAGMTNLRDLRLDANNITDISSLSALTNMDWLNIGFNNLTDVSPLSGLTKLTRLWLNRNNITDVSALAGMTNLRDLDLEFNNITDVSALASLTNLVFLDLRGNPPLSDSTKERIAALESSGVTVRFDQFRKGEFDIELVFSDDFTEAQKVVYRYVARRWMAVIEKDLPDYEFTKGWSVLCGGQSFEIPAGERIDDLRIYVTSFERDDGESAVGYGGPSVLREGSHLPVVGCMLFSLERPYLWITGLHEVGHVLGFSSNVWNKFGYRQDPPNGDRHFNGPLAIAAFDDAGGRDYSGAKVPLDPKTNSHWRYSVLAGEVMGPHGGVSLSAITVQSLADLGYGVDVTQADPYTLPGAAGKAIAKIAVSAPPILGDDQTFQFEGAERILGRRVTFDLPDNQWTWAGGSPSYAEPDLTCGAGQMNEPIYVVDPQGRIVRTINR